MRRLELLPAVDRKNDSYHKDLLKLLNDSDGAVLVLQKNRELRIKYFGLHEEEIVHALEWAKIKILDN